MNFKHRWRIKVPVNTTIHTNAGEVDLGTWIRQAAKASSAEVRERPLQEGANVVYVYIADDQDASAFRMKVPQELAQIVESALIGAGEL